MNTWESSRNHMVVIRHWLTVVFRCATVKCRLRLSKIYETFDRKIGIFPRLCHKDSPDTTTVDHYNAPLRQAKLHNCYPPLPKRPITENAEAPGLTISASAPSE